MKNPPFNFSVLRDLPPVKALRFLVGAAQEHRSVSPRVTIPEALILTGAMGETLLKPVKPEGLPRYLGFLVGNYITAINGVPTYITDTSFERWLETLSMDQAYGLSLQAYFCAMAQEIAASNEPLMIDVNEFFNISARKLIHVETNFAD